MIHTCCSEMKKIMLTVVLLGIIFAAAFIFTSKSNAPKTATAPLSPTPNTVTPLPTLPGTNVAIVFCGSSQLSGNISTEGAAGSIYATLTLTNIGNSTCKVILGNTISAIFDADNIDAQNVQSGQTKNFSLTPQEKVYSQARLPNGPQCQSGIVQKQISFFYKAADTSVEFKPTSANQLKLTVQACTSPAEKTTIDIWPLSENPVNQ